MQANSRNFLTACVIGWTLLIAAAVVYARRYDVSASIAVPVVAAILIEFIFYLATGFEDIRKFFTPPFILLSALIPYLVYAIPTGQFHLQPFFILLALVAGIAYWYIILPAVWWADLLFVVYVPAILLSRVLKDFIYVLPVRHVPVHVVLGHAMLIHTAAMSILVVRRFPGIGYGFVPSKKEILIGARNFLLFVPLGAVLGLSLGVFKYHGQSPLLTPALLLGYFWVLALSEELAFRGVLQQTLGQVTGNRHIALALASIAFGFVHIWFPGGFPNWRMMILATVAGWFYGKSFEQGGGIRAAMVTHALTVTVWLVWLA
jgi:membrane protease YdiL (CAAX protease family)